MVKYSQNRFAAAGCPGRERMNGMRRKDREITDFQEILDVVKRCKVCRLAMIWQGKPYLIPMNFGWEQEDGKLVIYLHTHLQGTKNQAMLQNPDVTFEMDTDGKLLEAENPCQYGYLFSSVVGSGKAELLENLEEKKQALASLMRHQAGKDFEFTDAMAKCVAVWRVRADELTGKHRVK